MNTTGPFQVMAGVPFTFDDPYLGGAADAVQIQNMTGFTLLVSYGTGSVSVGGDSQVTVPSYGGAQFVCQVIGTGPPGLGVILLWILPGEQAPTPDGPLTTQTTPSQSSAAQRNNTAVPIALVMGTGSTIIRLWHASMDLSTPATVGNEAALQVGGGGLVVMLLNLVTGPQANTKERSFLPWGVPFTLGSQAMELVLALSNGSTADAEIVYSVDVP